MSLYPFISKYAHWLLMAVMSLFFFIGLGNVHLFDWDEVNFAESAREMIVTGNYLSVQINFEPFWEKPPLFFWLQVVAMKVFGINEFAARFPNAVFGIIYLITVYFIGKKFRSDANFGRIWMLMIFGSLLPHIYFKSGIIDPVFNYFIFLSVFFAYKMHDSQGKSLKSIFWSGIFCGLSFLTKGPVGLLLLICTTLLASLLILIFRPNKNDNLSFFQNIKFIFNAFLHFSILKAVLIFIAGFLSIVSVWIGAELYFHGFDILMQFVRYQIELFTTPVATHGQPFYYHFIVVLLGCFPASVLAFPALFRVSSGTAGRFSAWMVSLFWVVMVIFSLSTTKIVHYSSMTYLPLTFLASCHIWDLMKSGQKLKNYQLVLYVVLVIFWSVVFISVPYILKNISIIMPYVKDQVVINSLHMPTTMKGFEPAFGILFFIGGFVSIWYLVKGKLFKGISIISFTAALFLLFFNLLVVPGVERLSQGPAIGFYKSLKNQDVYIETIGFKSYAHYFYAEMMPQNKAINKDISWILKGDIDKDAYLITKSDNTELHQYQDIQKIKSEGGFSFYIRKKKL